MKMRRYSNLVLVLAAVMLGSGCVIYRDRPVPVAEVQQAPPAPQIETPPPAPGPEYVWVDGYWGWHGRWVWSPGVWVVRPHVHAVWVGGHWVRGHRGYVWYPGRWR